MSKVNHNLKKKNANFVNLANNDLIRAYVKDIMKIKELSLEEERALMTEYVNLRDKEDRTNADENRMIEIKQAVISANQRFVYATAKRYAQTDDLLPDLISEANIAFDKSFDSFDLSKNTRIATLASWAMSGAITNYLTFNVPTIKQTNKRIVNVKVSDIQDEFMKMEHRQATNEELVELFREKYGIEVADKSDLSDLTIIHFDTCYDDEDTANIVNTKEFNDHACVNENEVYDDDYNAQKELINSLMGCLDEREKKVISYMYGAEELNAQEISKLIGLCPERVRQIAKGAIKKMQSVATVKA